MGILVERLAFGRLPLIPRTLDEPRTLVPRQVETAYSKWGHPTEVETVIKARNPTIELKVRTTFGSNILSDSAPMQLRQIAIELIDSLLEGPASRRADHIPRILFFVRKEFTYAQERTKPWNNDGQKTRAERRSLQRDG